MRHPIGMMLAGAAALGLAACTPADEAPVDAGEIEPPAVEAEEGVAEEPEMPEMPAEEAQAAAAAAAQAEAEAGVVYVGEDKKGAEVALPVGQTLRVELETIPTAGYTWQIVEKPDFLELTGENTRATNPALQEQPGFTGGNHYMSFDFQASVPGSGILRLSEGRAWESDEPASDTFEVTVTAAAAE